jgi:hypothetical protein
MPRRDPQHDPFDPHGFLLRTPPPVKRMALVIGVL